MPTVRLYLEDPYRRTFDAAILARDEEGWLLLDRTLFHPGGGGQWPDRGTLTPVAPDASAPPAAGGSFDVAGVREDDEGGVWHHVPSSRVVGGGDGGGDGGLALGVGARVQGALDWPFRHALMRHHALMHIVNTVARDRFDGIITGVQLGAERSRIDFRLPAFTRDSLEPFERAVNDVIARDLAITSAVITEEEFRRRPELIRTLNVLPPIVDGRVRIVEIASFDAQACGGTHVHSTGEIGPARIVKFENKGKDNKRFYWELA